MTRGRRRQRPEEVLQRHCVGVLRAYVPAPPAGPVHETEAETMTMTADERRRAILELRLLDNRSRQVWWHVASATSMTNNPSWTEYPLETHRPQGLRARFWRWVLGG